MSSTKEQGEQLSKLAYAEPPIVPEDLALALVIVCLFFAGIATIILALRVYVRAWMLRSTLTWGWEDTFAVLSYGAFVSSTVFAVKAAYYGLGTPDSKLNDFLMVRCAEYMLYSQVTYGISMPLVKASVVFMLLRVTPDRKYRWSLYAMLFITSVMALVGILASLTYCTPVRAYWNPLLGKCGDFNRVVTIGYVWTAVGIVTDWWCAILPFFIVRKLQMSRRAKTTVMLIMGLGAVASTATIVRAPYLQYYLATKDKLYWNGHISIWCQLESGIGIIAASLPSLRKLFNNYFDRSRNASGGVSGAKSSGAIRTIGGGEFTPGGTQLDSLTPNGKGIRSVTVSGGKWRRLEDENSSSKGILEDTEAYIETKSSSETR
ncbi:Fc.00g073850.m01.CDS01 [Cosmosporella sp. VM-42]